MKPGSAKGLLALSPLFVFLLVFVLSSVLAGDFYKVPVSSVFLIACIYAVAVSPQGSLKERIAVFSSGAGNHNVLLMIWIFILAGAFAGTAKDIGAIDAAVNVTMRLLPGRLLFAGLFLTACFISMSIGTSTGTIVALVPIASGIAGQCGVELPFMAALVVGGALFGDNLSFISDTTIAATRALGCEMRDKFRVNIFIVAPAVLVVFIIYLVKGSGMEAAPAGALAEWYKLFPYLLVIVLSLMGRNVTLILFSGIVANAVIGFASGSLGWVDWLSSVGRGISGMNDLIIVTLLAGGLLEMIRSNGGLDFLVERLTGRIRGKMGAQFSIAALVSAANLCTANNTIAIITTGGIARRICERYGLDARKVASILDTFSCMVQGLIPYGAQLLMAAGLAGCNPVSIIPFLYYPLILGFFSVLSIVFLYPEGKLLKK